MKSSDYSGGLTWRDVQHLVAWTSEPSPLSANPGWRRNAAGYWVNKRFGFGLLNAAGLASAADPARYVTVPGKLVCHSADTDRQLPRSVHTHTHTHNRLTAFGPGQPG